MMATAVRNAGIIARTLDSRKVSRELARDATRDAIRVVREIYARLCGLKIVGGAPDPPHLVIMAKFWRAMEPFYPAEAWKESGPLVEQVLDAIRVTRFAPQSSRTITKTCSLPTAFTSPVPKITVRPLKEGRGPRFSLTCRRCGHLRDLFTRTRANVEREAHAGDHRLEPRLGFVYKGFLIQGNEIIKRKLGSRELIHRPRTTSHFQNVTC